MLLVLPNELLFGEVLARTSSLLGTDFVRCAHSGFEVRGWPEDTIDCHDEDSPACDRCVYALTWARAKRYDEAADLWEMVRWCLSLRLVSRRVRDLVDRFGFALWSLVATRGDTARLMRMVSAAAPYGEFHWNHFRAKVDSSWAAWRLLERVKETLDAPAFRAAPAPHALALARVRSMEVTRENAMRAARDLDVAERRVVAARRRLQEAEERRDDCRHFLTVYRRSFDSARSRAHEYLEATVGAGKRVRALAPGVGRVVRLGLRLPVKRARREAAPAPDDDDDDDDVVVEISDSEE